MKFGVYKEEYTNASESRESGWWRRLNVKKMLDTIDD